MPRRWGRRLERFWLAGYPPCAALGLTGDHPFELWLAGYPPSSLERPYCGPLLPVPTYAYPFPHFFPCP